MLHPMSMALKGRRHPHGSKSRNRSAIELFHAPIQWGTTRFRHRSLHPILLKNFSTESSTSTDWIYDFKEALS